VFLVLVIVHAKRMRRIILLSVGPLAVPLFLHITLKKAQFSEVVIENKMCVLHFPYNFCLQYFSF